MKNYENLSSIYDLFMDDYDYKKIIDRFEPFLIKANVKNVLDLACGTGNVSRELYERSYNVTGIDLSEEMLMRAQEKALELNYKIKFLNSDMRSFSIKSKFDAVISLTDGFNYLLTEEDINKTLTNIYNHLEDEGLLIFDMSTIYKFREIIGNTTFAENDEESSYIWENYFNEKDNILEFDITIFEKINNENIFKRTMESHTQRGYSIEVIEKLLKESKFEIVEIYGLNDSLEISDRIFYIAKKIK